MPSSETICRAIQLFLLFPRMRINLFSEFMVVKVVKKIYAAKIQSFGILYVFLLEIEMF